MKKFEEPKAEIIQFVTEDVIAASGDLGVVINPCYDGGCGSDCNEFNVDF